MHHAHALGPRALRHVVALGRRVVDEDKGAGVEAEGARKLEDCLRLDDAVGGADRHHVLLLQHHLARSLAEHPSHVFRVVSTHEAQQGAAPLPRDEAALHVEIGLAEDDAVDPEFAHCATP